MGAGRVALACTSERVLHMTMHSTNEPGDITYTISYQYGTYSGQRKVTLAADDQRDPCAVMWARMRNAGELTLPMAYQSARIIDEQASEE